MISSNMPLLSLLNRVTGLLLFDPKNALIVKLAHRPHTLLMLHLLYAYGEECDPCSIAYAFVACFQFGAFWWFYTVSALPYPWLHALLQPVACTALLAARTFYKKKIAATAHAAAQASRYRQKLA